MSSNDYILQVESLKVSYGDVTVVWEVDIVARRGAITALIGANGTGKTTTLKTIAGLLKKDAGEILFNGRSLASTPAFQRVEEGLCLVPEGRRVFPYLTLEDNLRVGAYTRRARSRMASTIAEVYNLFPRLAERRRQIAGSLSGGEQQMLAIGRGLMSGPQLLMLDEPSLGLAPLIVRRLFELIQEINRRGVSILLVEQNIESALRICEKAYVMETGRIALEGEGNELLAHPRIRQAYLGL